jgi:hypothetical protein
LGCLSEREVFRLISDCEQSLWPLLAADIRTASQRPWALHDQRSGTWLFTSPDFIDDPIPTGYPLDGLAVVFLGSTTLVDPEDNSEQAQVIAVADTLQHLAMDELGRPWPEARDGAGNARLLTPALVDDGSIAWVATGCSPIAPRRRLLAVLLRREQTPG